MAHVTTPQGANRRSDAAVMFMPSPTSLRAQAVWITARNWAYGLSEALGSVELVTPERSYGAHELASLTGARVTTGAREVRPRRLPTLRTALKDLDLVRRRTLESRRARAETARPRLIWQHHDLFFSPAGKHAAAAHVPVVQFVDAMIVWESRNWGVARPGYGRLLERAGERPQLAAADIVLCVSDKVAEVVESAGVESSRIALAPCTADERLFHPRLSRVDCRQKWNLETSDILYGWVGSFRRFHGLELAMEAFSRTAAVVPDAKLILVGDGPQKREMIDLAAALGVTSKVVFVGSVDHEEVPALVGAMDVALLTASTSSDFHYSPLKLREYLAAGKAIVAPAVGQVAELLDGRLNEALYPVGDVEAMSTIMVRLGQDATGRARSEEAAVAIHRAEGGIARQVEDLLARLQL